MDDNISALWLLTLEYFKKDVKKAEDNLIILVHWLLLKNNFQVLRHGNENGIDDNEQSTDFLPANWSEDLTYKLRYVRDNGLFLLNGVKAGDSFILNFYDVTTKTVASVALGNIFTTVELIKNYSNNKDDFLKTINLLQMELINSMQKDDKKIATTQTQFKQSGTNSESSLFVPILSRIAPNNYNSNMPRNPFPSYGISDLNPLGSLNNSGGGMIFDPLGIGNGRTMGIPGVPPMARFDPTRPFNPDPMVPTGFGRPNPDHIRPPEFDDEMHM